MISMIRPSFRELVQGGPLTLAMNQLYNSSVALFILD